MKLGGRHSTETRLKMKQSAIKRGISSKGYTPWNKGKPWSKEIRAKMSKSMKGRKHSPETIAKISKNRTGKRSSLGFAGKTHSLETRAKMSESMKGRKSSFAGKMHSFETKARISKKLREYKLAHMEFPPENCQCAAHKTWKWGNPTKLELILETLLSDFPEVEFQKQFGRFRVDAYLPDPYHLAFEADGSYWHDNRKDYDMQRDAELLDRFSLPVIRLSEEDLLPCLPKSLS